MPKSMELTPGYDSDGIRITYTKSRDSLDFSMWYETYVGADCGTLTLGDFLRQLGITQQMCAKALREEHTP